MDTFTLGLPRWPIVRMFGRNPLVRISDRVEAAVLGLAVVVWLLAAPVAGAVGTAVHDSRSHLYAEQAQTRHAVTATVTDTTDPTAGPDPATKPSTVRARWLAGGREHTGPVSAQSTIKVGDGVGIWVDDFGDQVDAPTPATLAVVQAVLAALGIWLAAVAAAAALFGLTRLVVDRVRSTGWQHDLDVLVDHGGGHTSNQP
ncbi:MAG TPA: hypothetical protein VKI00_06715 [Mycobacterium sp.]|uniref:Rv1733c family protein n=1 Tax=Mycobacterium sp. TaxID=1785 RepID=UPI002B7B542B|nr:hypothetical protein [Mycobacterium sp.]HME75350.1 hypothetical protein [Mycobacterium sp.]